MASIKNNIHGHLDVIIGALKSGAVGGSRIVGVARTVIMLAGRDCSDDDLPRHPADTRTHGTGDNSTPGTGGKRGKALAQH